MSAHQTASLEEIFLGTQAPTSVQYQRISEGLGLPRSVVMAWFQGKRQRLRRESEGDEVFYSLTAPVSPPRSHPQVSPAQLRHMQHQQQQPYAETSDAVFMRKPQTAVHALLPQPAQAPDHRHQQQQQQQQEQKEEDEKGSPSGTGQRPYVMNIDALI
ncbi:hypothetical protein HDU83_001829 [Entophlyctis luteolus]|nr:hypothetical protein HDU83_001829 [Entophlyctis luteolus]